MRKTRSTPGSRGVRDAVNRYATGIKAVSVALIVGSMFVALGRLPLGPMFESLETWIASLGLVGPIVFGLLYVVAVLLLLPGSAWTLAAGALFGLGTGTVVASLSSTTAAALAFLIARYLARDWVVRGIHQYPRLDALDQAVREGGWKVVALLRLSPAVPFTLQNYAYGLTGLRFGPYLLTSWLAMLPGTFLYVYLGHFGRVSVEAAGHTRSRSPAEWAMLAVGFLATLAVTVYLTYLARKALWKRTVAAEEVSASPAIRPEHTEAEGWPCGVMALAAIALAALAAAVLIVVRPDLLTILVGR
jgi:uncharacterized membrane protein YdjX (TVP38/TMEM64 family)